MRPFWFRPVGNGVICGFADNVFPPETACSTVQVGATISDRTLRDGSMGSAFQALRARLPSCRPFGTENLCGTTA
jgi:hypothetical protein